jgi:hypothetical protein
MRHLVFITLCGLLSGLQAGNKKKNCTLSWFYLQDYTRMHGQQNMKFCIVQLKCDGTRWRTGGEVKGKLANGVGGQYPSHYLGTWCIQHYYLWCAHLGCQVVDWTDAPADLNKLVHFAERRNLFCACAITFQLASIYIPRVTEVP